MGRNWCQGEIGVSSFFVGEIGEKLGRNWGEIGEKLGRNWCQVIFRGEIGVRSFFEPGK
jgi:hypothetical protein